MIKQTMFVVLLLSLGSCDDDKVGFPAAPALKSTIVDRMGRPAINTALVDPFWNTGTAGDTEESHQARQDVYNTQAPSAWASNVANFKDKLAVFDALDGTCGNQIAFAAVGNPDYTTLATVLADDEIYVFAGASASCQGFLAVEAATLGGTAPADCGGRRPGDNVVDVVYSALATGMTSGVSNGVTSDPDGAPPTTFPYLSSPQ